MIHGRTIMTVHPCGIVVHSSDEAIDLCHSCARDDCPTARDERACRGGCTPCTCKESS